MVQLEKPVIISLSLNSTVIAHKCGCGIYVLVHRTSEAQKKYRAQKAFTATGQKSAVAQIHANLFETMEKEQIRQSVMLLFSERWKREKKKKNGERERERDEERKRVPRLDPIVSTYLLFTYYIHIRYTCIAPCDHLCDCIISYGAHNPKHIPQSIFNNNNYIMRWLSHRFLFYANRPRALRVVAHFSLELLAVDDDKCVAVCPHGGRRSCMTIIFQCIRDDRWSPLSMDCFSDVSGGSEAPKTTTTIKKTKTSSRRRTERWMHSTCCIICVCVRLIASHTQSMRNRRYTC